ncbi:MAG: hypothetical protein EXR77_01505 [Myxococcales bacterium]|nr:hypothetical protein [Myxococcales bacterium]
MNLAWLGLWIAVSLLPASLGFAQADGASSPSAEVAPAKATGLAAAATTTADPSLPKAATRTTELAATTATDVAMIAFGAGALVAAEGACVLRPIAAVEFVGCADQACGDSKVLSQLASVVDLRPGRKLQSGELRVAWDRLLRIGFFKSVQLRCQRNAEGNGLIRFEVAPHAFVKRIHFAGNSALFVDELRTKLLIQPGDALDLDTVGGRERMQAQKEAIEAVYQRNGFDGAKIRLRSVALGHGNLALWIDISEGERRRINDAKFEIQAPPRRSEFEEHHGLRCPVVSERAVRLAAAVQGLDVFSQREANRVRSRIRTYLRRIGFGSARIEVHHETSDQTIRIDVVPGKCSIVRILLRDDSEGSANAGFELQEDRALYDALSFGDSGLYDFAEAERGRQDLLIALENRGYLFADARLDFRPVPPSESGQVISAITYYAATGYVSQVRGIFFHAVDKRSAAALDDAALRNVVSTRAYDFFDAGGYLQIDQVLADLDLLRQFFISQGYWEFRYALTLPEHATPTAANRRTVSTVDNILTIAYRYPDKGFRLRKPLEESFIYLDIDYFQGEPTRLRGLQVTGANVITQAAVRALWPLKSGDIVSFEKLERALTELEASYRNSGFFRSHVTMLCSSTAPDRPLTECTRTTLLARQIDVELHISEGERVDFGESFVIGAFNTDIDVVTRDLPRAGEPYSAALEFESQRRLRGLGLFAQVSFARVGDDEKPPRRRLGTVVRVVEEQNRYWEGLTGFQTINTARNSFERESIAGFKEVIDHATTATDRAAMGYGRAQNLILPNLLATAEAAYVDKNFARSGKLLRLAAKVGLTAPPEYAASQTRYNAEYLTPPWWSDTLRYAAASLTYHDPRLLGTEFGLRWVIPAITHDYALSVVDQDKVSSLVEISRRFGRLLTAVSLDYGFLRLRPANLRDRDFDNANSFFGLSQQLLVTPSVSYDNTDSPLNPTRGLSLQLSLPYINGYIRDSQDSSEPFKLANMIKWEGTGRMYLPVGDSLVLATMVHGGVVYPFSDAATAELPQNITFRLGGQYPQSLLRGYADYGIRRYDSSGKPIVRDKAGNLVELQTIEDKTSPKGRAFLETDYTVGYGRVVANGALELRFPVSRDLKLSGALYWDFGALADDASDLWGGVRHGLGGSLVWMLAGQIPVRFDLAFTDQRDRCIDIGKGTDGKYDCLLEESIATYFGLMYAF